MPRQLLHVIFLCTPAWLRILTVRGAHTVALHAQVLLHLRVGWVCMLPNAGIDMRTPSQARPHKQHSAPCVLSSRLAKEFLCENDVP